MTEAGGPPSATSVGAPLMPPLRADRSSARTFSVNSVPSSIRRIADGSNPATTPSFSSTSWEAMSSPSAGVRFTRSDELARALVDRAHEARVLRADATIVDVSLLVEQFEAQGRADLAVAAANARHRVIAIALDGLRAGDGSLPGSPPGPGLPAERW